MDNIVVRHFLTTALTTLLSACGSPCDSAMRPPSRIVVPYVGQGTGALVFQGTRAIAFDAGPDSSNVLSQELRSAGIASLEILVVSHWDLDHVGGLDTLVAKKQVKRVLFGAEPVDSWMRSKKEAWCKAIPDGCAVAAEGSGSLVLDGDRLDFLKADSDAMSENARSVVARLSDASGNGILLAPGDLDTTGEASLLARHSLLAAKVLLVGHHGSRGSSSLPFLGAVGATTAFIQAGMPNSYGHPHRETIERLRAIIPDVRRPLQGRSEFVIP